MIFFLLLGAALGALSIIFILQNNAPVAVHFFNYSFDSSLAAVLFLALVFGMLVTLFVILPSFVKLEWRMRKLQRQNKQLTEELVGFKQKPTSISAQPEAVEETKSPVVPSSSLPQPDHNTAQFM